jgi:hypothetical protein
MQHPANELPRITLPRTSVNTGKKKGGRVKIIGNSSPLATNTGRNNPLGVARERRLPIRVLSAPC